MVQSLYETDWSGAPDPTHLLPPELIPTCRGPAEEQHPESEATPHMKPRNMDDASKDEHARGKLNEQHWEFLLGRMEHTALKVRT